MKNMIKIIGVLGLSAMCVVPAQAITKCKDADGKWHYGDFAVSECNRSKVTELNDRGTKVSEQAAPKTAEQLKSEADEAASKQAKKDMELAREEEKRRVLSIYETEFDIDRQRDNQLVSVQGNIDVHNAYLRNMDGRIKRLEKKVSEAAQPYLKEGFEKELVTAKKNVEVSTEGLQKLEAQKQAIIDKFSQEKELYRRLTRKDQYSPYQ